MLAIRGKIDDLRIQRLNAWKIVEGFRGSAEMPEIWNFYPLRFDDELIEKDKEQTKESLEEWYNQASREASEVIWEKKK